MTSQIPTPLFDFHRENGARLVDFAGFALPLQYSGGIIAEHRHTRSQASLFDVSHMGQLLVRGPDAARALERLLPIDTRALPPGRQTYSLMLNEDAGIVDDLMVTRLTPHKFLLVVNAARLKVDLQHIGRHLRGADCVRWQDRALLALQGPQAADVLAPLVPDCARLRFLEGCWAELDGTGIYLSRSGYTGEDGFELSVPADQATVIAGLLLQDPRVQPAGLGARDTLRMEAGLCLYGQDLDESTSPLEAGLGWCIAGARRPEGDREHGYVGAAAMAHMYRRELARRRAGLVLTGRVPVRAGASLVNDAGDEVGTVTSGGFGPSVAAPIAHAYLQADFPRDRASLFAVVRGRRHPAVIQKMPFVPTRYVR